MWCPKPKPKVVSRPKLVVRHYHQRKKIPETESNNNSALNGGNEPNHDPHRGRRHYGMKHTDVTRMFLVEDRACHVPNDQPYGLKKTDITRYLERVVPSHAFQVSNTSNGRSQTTPRNTNNAQPQPQTYKKEMHGGPRGAYPTRPPSRCETRESRSDRVASRENLRPDTAPTGEMRRLSATNASTGNFSNKPASAGSGRRAMTSSPLRPREEKQMALHLKRGSNSENDQTTSDPRGGIQGLQSALKDPTVSCAPRSRCLTGSSITSGGRLQPVPE